MRELVAAVDATCLIIEHQRRRPENWNASREEQTRKRRAVGWKIVVCGHSCRVLADPDSVTRCAEDQDLLSISSFVVAHTYADVKRNLIGQPNASLRSP